jgi:NADH-quinone oxidoreductase subunit K
MSPDVLNSVPVHHYLVVGAILFALGMIGFLARRNLIIMFLSAEMMLQGVTINLVAFARYRGNLQGQAFTLFILTVAACEAAIALALILMLYRSRRSLDVSLWQDLREPGQEPTLDEEPLPAADDPRLVPLEAPAGSVVLLHGLLPHRSGANRSDRSRHAYSVHLIDEGARYPADNWLQRPAELPLRGF